MKTNSTYKHFSPCFQVASYRKSNVGTGNWIKYGLDELDDTI